MAKRLTIPAKVTVIISGGSGTASVSVLNTGAVVLSYLSIIGPSGNTKGKVRITDEDEGGVSIWKDPKDETRKIFLDFYANELRIPLNGNYKITLTESPDGTYDVYYVLEERPARV